MPLLEALRQEATKRSLWPPEGRSSDQPPGATEVFALVRDMPYGRASSRDPRTTIREWRGTCSGKHYLLRSLFAELGLAADLMACTTRITAENSPYLPPDLRRLLAAGSIIDVHNYLILHTHRGPMRVDATWPLSMKTLGLPVNEEFVWGRDMALACDPIVHQTVAHDGDPRCSKTVFSGSRPTRTSLPAAKRSSRPSAGMAGHRDREVQIALLLLVRSIGEGR